MNHSSSTVGTTTFERNVPRSLGTAERRISPG